MMNNIESIIFDFDGTLADTLPLCINSFTKAFEITTGKMYTSSEITAYFGTTEEGIVKKLTPNCWEESLKFYLEIYEQNQGDYPDLFKGISEILDNLKSQNVKMALVPGKGKPSCDIALNFYDLNKYFDYVETGSPEGSIKPICINNILKKWRISPEKVVYVGDQPTDIIDSKQAGVKAIAVSWATTSNHNLLLEQKPDLIFSETINFYNWISKNVFG